ncbi:MAG: D-amino acid dehydrogenase [Pseudomonadota bacterium]
MRVVILGAGLLGITTAYYLSQAGCEVTVLDRQSGPGLETSFANGGQISVGQAEPWANPSTPKKALKWMRQENSPLVFKMRLDLAQWRWALQFLQECLPSNTRHNIQNIVAISLYSRQELQHLRNKLGLEYDHLERGILNFFTDQLDFDAAIAGAEVVRQYGCEREVKTVEQCIQIEPALAACRSQLKGGMYTPTDESGDAYLFCQRLAEEATKAGVVFRYGVNIQDMLSEGGEISGVRFVNERRQEETLSADRYVVALGSYSTALLSKAGIDLPLYPAKGYSVTLPILDPTMAPNVSLMDDYLKIVFTRLGDRLRVAGTAELNGYNLDINHERCEVMINRVMELFPGVAKPEEAERWTGLRPATPSNVPLIGRSRFPNLFLNTGHGTLGWTMACGSAKALADIINNKKPEVDFAFLKWI